MVFSPVYRTSYVSHTHERERDLQAVVAASKKKKLSIFSTGDPTHIHTYKRARAPSPPQKFPSFSLINFCPFRALCVCVQITGQISRLARKLLLCRVDDDDDDGGGGGGDDGRPCGRGFFH